MAGFTRVLFGKIKHTNRRTCYHVRLQYAYIMRILVFMCDIHTEFGTIEKRPCAYDVTYLKGALA